MTLPASEDVGPRSPACPSPRPSRCGSAGCRPPLPLPPALPGPMCGRLASVRPALHTPFSYHVETSIHPRNRMCSMKRKGTQTSRTCGPAAPEEFCTPGWTGDIQVIFLTAPRYWRRGPSWCCSQRSSPWPSPCTPALPSAWRTAPWRDGGKVCAPTEQCGRWASRFLGADPSTSRAAVRTGRQVGGSGQSSHLRAGSPRGPASSAAVPPPSQPDARDPDFTADSGWKRCGPVRCTDARRGHLKSRPSNAFFIFLKTRRPREFKAGHSLFPRRKT